MKKRMLVCLALLPAIVACLLVGVSAHTGKTDSSGGHYDHDTGEYHYHHGYSAHDHYDMDGDGIIDCPYDFDDKTGINSGSAPGWVSSSVNDSNGADNIIYETKTVVEEVPYTPSWIYWVLGCLAALCLIAFLLVWNKVSEIDYLQKTLYNERDRHDKDLSDMKAKCASQISQHKSHFEGIIADKDSQISKCVDSLQSLRDEKKSLQNKYTLLMNTLGKQAGTADAAKAIDGITLPKDVYFINGSVPVKGEVLDRRPFGDYTVFATTRGKCYHSDPYCAGYSSVATHIFEVLESRKPCSKCGYGLEERVPDWYTQLKQITKSTQNR